MDKKKYEEIINCQMKSISANEHKLNRSIDGFAKTLVKQLYEESLSNSFNSDNPFDNFEEKCITQLDYTWRIGNGYCQEVAESVRYYARECDEQLSIIKKYGKIGRNYVRILKDYNEKGLVLKDIVKIHKMLNK